MPMPSKALSFKALALVAVVVFALYGLAEKPSASGGRAAPALPHESLVGPTQALASMLSAEGHRPAAVVFWASWCGPCAHEAPAIERFAQSADGRGRVVGVNWSDALSGARSFLKRYAWTFPNVRDAEGTVGNAYRITGLPTTFVLDGSGRIRAVLRGPQSERSLEAALRAA
jgi:cytochrome c biogenesis protein CcmG, thiol:disulfide interchange protein DsbE